MYTTSPSASHLAGGMSKQLFVFLLILIIAFISGRISCRPLNHHHHHHHHHHHYRSAEALSWLQNEENESSSSSSIAHLSNSVSAMGSLWARSAATHAENHENNMPKLRSVTKTRLKTSSPHHHGDDDVEKGDYTDCHDEGVGVELGGLIMNNLRGGPVSGPSSPANSATLTSPHFFASSDASKSKSKSKYWSHEESDITSP